MRWVCLVVACLSAACATPTASTASVVSIGEPAAMPGESKDLAQAWERPEPEAAPKAVLLPPLPPAVDRAASFKEALAAGQAALKGKRLDEARASATTARAEAERLDGEARHQAGWLALRVEVAAQDGAAAVEAALAWHRACGPEKLDACRRAATSALAQAAKVPGADKGALALARALDDADDCAKAAEKSATPPACVGASQRTAQQRKDALLLQRIALAQALHEKQEDRQVALLEKAEGKCAAPTCAGLRRKALGRLMAHAKAKGDAEAVVRYALRDQDVATATLPDAERFYARTKELEAACPAYDAAAGAGACRALEQKLTGRWTFRDWSRDSAGEALSADVVRRVNEHFAPLVQRCLAEQAKRMTPPDAQRFEVRWVVVNDGRVAEVHLRRDLDEVPLAHCLREQFVDWRYPRYEGEYQNVEQSFTVTATERRLR